MNPMIKDRHGPVRAAGEDEGAWLAALEQGANLLQDMTRSRASTNGAPQAPRR